MCKVESNKDAELQRILKKEVIGQRKTAKTSTAKELRQNQYLNSKKPKPNSYANQQLK